MRLSCTLPHLLGLSLIFQMEIPDYWAQCLPAQSKTCHRRFGSWKAEPQTWENVCCVTHGGTFVTSTAGLRAVAHLDMAGKGGRSLHFVGSSLPRLPPSFPPAVVREHNPQCTIQLHKQGLHLSSGDLDQCVFYSTIRVLLWDSPLASRRFLLETHLPLCHLW